MKRISTLNTRAVTFAAGEMKPTAHILSSSTRLLTDKRNVGISREYKINGFAVDAGQMPPKNPPGRMDSIASPSFNES